MGDQAAQALNTAKRVNNAQTGGNLKTGSGGIGDTIANKDVSGIGGMVKKTAEFEGQIAAELFGKGISDTQSRGVYTGLNQTNQAKEKYLGIENTADVYGQKPGSMMANGGTTMPQGGNLNGPGKRATDIVSQNFANSQKYDSIERNSNVYGQSAGALPVAREGMQVIPEGMIEGQSHQGPDGGVHIIAEGGERIFKKEAVPQMDVMAYNGNYEGLGKIVAKEIFQQDQRQNQEQFGGGGQIYNEQWFTDNPGWTSMGIHDVKAGVDGLSADYSGYNQPGKYSTQDIKKGLMNGSIIFKPQSASKSPLGIPEQPQKEIGLLPKDFSIFNNPNFHHSKENLPEEENAFNIANGPGAYSGQSTVNTPITSIPSSSQQQVSLPSNNNAWNFGQQPIPNYTPKAQLVPIPSATIVSPPPTNVGGPTSSGTPIQMNPNQPGFNPWSIIPPNTNNNTLSRQGIVNTPSVSPALDQYELKPRYGEEALNIAPNVVSLLHNAFMKYHAGPKPIPMTAEEERTNRFVERNTDLSNIAETDAKDIASNKQSSASGKLATSLGVYSNSINKKMDSEAKWYGEEEAAKNRNIAQRNNVSNNNRMELNQYNQNEAANKANFRQGKADAVSAEAQNITNKIKGYGDIRSKNADQMLNLHAYSKALKIQSASELWKSSPEIQAANPNFMKYLTEQSDINDMSDINTLLNSNILKSYTRNVKTKKK